MQKSLMFAVAMAASGSFSAAHAAQGNGASTAKVLKQITVTAGTDLSFGTFASDGSGNTHVDMDTSGSVTCLGASVCGLGAPSRGMFSVTGTSNQAIDISGAGNFFLYNGANSVEIGNIVYTGSGVTSVSYFHSTGVLDGSGNLTFGVSGSLWKTLSTPAGDYSGTYTVTINYL
jgi:hypothetical protein